MKRVLLFGGSGFLGSQVATVLEPTAVLIIVGRRQHDLVKDSTAELAALITSTEPDVVVNCTGLLSGSAADLVTGNVLTTANLIDAVKAAAPEARLIVLGSAGEYGVVPAGQPVTEDSPTIPVAAYGITKLASTALIQASGLDALSLRVFNPIGPGSGTDTVLGRAAACMRAAMEQGSNEILLGPLGSYRDFVDVRDVARAIATAALAPHIGETVLNVGSGNAVLIRDAVKLLAEVAGFAGEIRESDAPQQRSGAVNWIAADTTRIARTLGWQPEHDLESSVRAMIS
ncbi:nucleoside-diphosphate-sugar epimerase [Kibdelosporangium banguiense]|uniref:Nucleoside-diphosphate-sugar epimerase n=1 Tax=Kibdelosporangium banguiense TaxID=1365924 RepID=A0ABS4T8C6_9PSEU|nr:NAD(P)-dependent oxidoreductase [Kibdelosporangium banguiense]MBP2320670.1 nucleoside-diphosphate-sugar epimerase [Kibdelosporangium banguiense]